MTTEAEIERIALCMIETSLPKPEWTHRAHFAAALWLLAHPDILVREGGMARLIRRYNKATGTANTDTGGYHATITEASLRAAAVCLADNTDASIAMVLDVLMASELGTPRWPLAYWSEECLMSIAARRHWVGPDLAPLPWPTLATPAYLA